MWKDGKQDGEGESYTKEKEWRKGIWSEGKRVNWI